MHTIECRTVGRTVYGYKTCEEAVKDLTALGWVYDHNGSYVLTVDGVTHKAVLGWALDSIDISELPKASRKVAAT